MFQVQHVDKQDVDHHEIPSLEELPSKLQKKEDSMLSIKYFINVNISTSY